MNHPYKISPNTSTNMFAFGFLRKYATKRNGFFFNMGSVCGEGLTNHPKSLFHLKLKRMGGGRVPFLIGLKIRLDSSLAPPRVWG